MKVMPRLERTWFQLDTQLSVVRLPTGGMSKNSICLRISLELLRDVTPADPVRMCIERQQSIPGSDQTLGSIIRNSQELIVIQAPLPVAFLIYPV